MIHIKGLTDAEVEASRRKHGTNQLTPQEVETFWDKLKDNLKDPMIVILIFALIIVVILAVFGFTEWYEGVGIAAAVALATLVATGSEFKNEQTFQKLQEEASKIFVNVFRKDALKMVGIDDIVVDDKVFLQPGDKIPSDGKLIDGKIKVNQAMLTGEPEAVTKTPGKTGDRNLENPHRVYRGTIVEDGEAVMEVEVVGDNTHFGKLAQDLKAEERPGPLRVKLAKLADDIAMFGYVGATCIAIAFMFKATVMDYSGAVGEYFSAPYKITQDALDEINKGNVSEELVAKLGSLRNQLRSVEDKFLKTLEHTIGPEQTAQHKALILEHAYVSPWGAAIKDFVTALILAVIIIVVAVPEGLPMMIAIVLAQNMRKLLKSHVLVRQLLGIETSGSLNLLFSDKTGTITQGKLDAVGFLTVNEEKDDYVSSYETYDDMPSKLAQLLNLSLRENTSCVVNPHAENDAERILGGNTTERALLKFVRADFREYEEENDLLAEVLFNSARKFSGARIKMSSGDEITLIKGAAEKVLAKCTSYYDANGEIRPLSETIRDLLSEQMDQKAEDGFRIIAVATTENPVSEKELSEELALLGFSLIRDELREDSKPAIKALQGAGIHVVMLTGDRYGTAKAIATDVGLITSEEDVIVKSEDMSKLSDEEIKELLPKLKVVSRCLPQDKTRLVKLAQELGLVVGMTGDGVNDSPALSNADIGFALGSGTEVAKEASDIVVLDDNIHSIANAVHYGRSIYRSVQKFITFQLTVNVSAIMIAFLGPFLGFELPLTMIQLLWVNLIMDTLAALAFSGEPPLPKHMKEKPKDREEKLITSNMWASVLCNGIFIAVLSIFFLKSEFIHSLFQRPGASAELNEMIFLTAFFGMFVFLNNFNKFNVRVEEFNLFHHIFANKGFLRVVGMIFVIHLLITYFGGDMFRTVPLQLNEWLYIVGLSILIIPFDLMRKYFCWIFE